MSGIQNNAFDRLTFLSIEVRCVMVCCSSDTRVFSHSFFFVKTENVWKLPLLPSSDKIYQDRHCKYNLILRGVHVTIVAVEKQ